MGKVYCPICGPDAIEFEEYKQKIFTQCSKCKTVFFIKELLYNFRRWKTKEHVQWIQDGGMN